MPQLYQYLLRSTIGLLCLFQGQAWAQIYFVENAGQWPEEVLFRADIPDGYLSVESNALVYTRLYSNNLEYFHHGPSKGDTLLVHNQRIEMLGANTMAKGLGQKKRKEYHNYFIGNDPSKWASKVGLFEKVIIFDIYPGIDLEVYSRDAKTIKYDFIVHAGANPNAIALKYLGQESLHLKNGALHIETGIGEIIEEAPFAYQLQAKSSPNIGIRYALEGSVMRFNIDRYNKSQALTIDPVVVFSTYTGSSSDNFGFTATYTSWDMVMRVEMHVDKVFPAFQESFRLPLIMAPFPWTM